mmetsp:Transcript_45758/g.115181  ORF Transcript_45758/g.115181 Transcript_45758/m.115181 type:complete len:256 (+) Transcript_45758:258-1025(+)
MNLKDLHPTSLIGERDLDFAIQTTGTQKSRIQCIRTVRGHHHFHLTQFIKTVHLVKQLHQSTLNFTISRCSFGKTTATNGINLIHKDDARLMITCVTEHFANQTCTLTDVLVHDCTRDNLEKGGIDIACQSTSHQSFSGTRRTIQKHTLRRLDTNTLEELRGGERQFDYLTQFVHLLIETANGRIADSTRILTEHVEYHRIDLSRESSHNGQCGHVESDTSSSSQRSLVNLFAATNHISGTARRLHNESFFVELT